MATSSLDRRDADILDDLLGLELAALEVGRRALAAVRGDPLIRGAIASFLAEHELHASALEALGARRPRPSTRGTGPSSEGMQGFEGTSAALRALRAEAELATRRYGAAMERASPSLVPAIRAQRNAWLRQRAWLGARIEAFAARPSRAP